MDEQQTHITCLPMEIMSIIFCFVFRHDKITLITGVCKVWKRILENVDNVKWMLEHTLSIYSVLLCPQFPMDDEMINRFLCHNEIGPQIQMNAQMNYFVKKGTNRMFQKWLFILKFYCKGWKVAQPDDDELKTIVDYVNSNYCKTPGIECCTYLGYEFSILVRHCNYITANWVGRHNRIINTNTFYHIAEAYRKGFSGELINEFMKDVWEKHHEYGHWDAIFTIFAKKGLFLDFSD